MIIILKIVTICILCKAGIAYEQIFSEENNITSDVFTEHSKEVLSRRKRFIIFPEGSSFQLVFCNTFPHISYIGDIILWGYTAALAYELPQDPYSPFDHHGDPLHRRVDTKAIYYTDEKGRIIYHRPYKTKLIVNPAFAKRSIDAQTNQLKNEDTEHKIDRKRMHASENSREYLNGQRVDAQSAEFHRTSRVLLFRKIETMLQGLGGNGRQCLLKTLCLVGQAQNRPQGSFFQELLRATFTFPKGELEEAEDSEYDAAVVSGSSCDDRYPECPDSTEDLRE